jgi:hypothetical protein
MHPSTRATSWKSAAHPSALAELETIPGTWRRIDAMWRQGLLDDPAPARKSASTSPILVERFEVE